MVLTEKDILVTRKFCENKNNYLLNQRAKIIQTKNENVNFFELWKMFMYSTSLF